MECEICGKETGSGKILCCKICEMQYNINKLTMENRQLCKDLKCMRRENKKLDQSMDRLFKQFKAEIRYLKKEIDNPVR
jgi:predicted RNase H-like nuclease (RuvC/YqgF family)